MRFKMNRTWTIVIAMLSCYLPCVAQQKPFTYFGIVEPQQISFGETSDDVLFQQYLSSFVFPFKKDTCSLYVNFVNEYNQKELDSIFFKFVVIVPGFQSFPAFRIDCLDGYVIGLYHTYHSIKVEICNLDVMSYDKYGRILERTTFPLFQTGYFYTQDSCHIAYQSKGGVLNIENGVVFFEYESSRCCTPEMAKGELYADDVKVVRRERRKYVYEIGDNACIVLKSVSDIYTE